MADSHRRKILLVHLIFLSTFPAFATDMYLPALPTMVDHLQASVTMVNLTLLLFFFFFGASILFWGTISDKYGRKATLLVGAGLFTLAGVLCAVAADVYQLIVFRIVQAIGSGATVSVSMAVIKDVFEGRQRARALSFAATLSAIAPIIAPLLGGVILQVVSWRGVFGVLAGLGAAAFAGCLLMRDTTPHREKKSLLGTLFNIAVTLRNPGFTKPLIIISLMSTPVLTYLVTASTIYISGFGLSEQVFSYFFSANAFLSAFGPMIYLVAARHVSTLAVIKFSFFMIVVSGLILIFWGQRSPFLFALGVLPASLCVFMARPPSVNMLLEQAGELAGAASSLIHFSSMFFGSLGMMLISLDWSNRILAYGSINAATGLICMILWPLLWKKTGLRVGSR